jgi:hypothetical protein
MRKLFVGVALIALVAAGCKVVVTPSAPNGWSFINEAANGSGHFVNGPGTPPAGRGSALLTVDGSGREAIATTAYANLALAGLTQLKYSTYQAFSGSPNEPLTLAFDVDYDSTDASNAYQGRLVYVPSMAGAITPKTWQNWNTMTGTAAWYSSGSDASAYRPIVGNTTQANPPCNQTTFCTWAQVLSNYPNAKIRPGGALMVRAGGPVTGGMVAATDNVIVGIGGLVVENNFEPGDGHVAVTSANDTSLGFGFGQETPTGSGGYVTGPNGSDGTGSVGLTINSTGGELYGTGVFSATALDRFRFLSYKTYQKDPGTNAATLQLDADYDSADASTAFQGRIVFEPSVSGQQTVTNETWQTWNPLTAPSGWWQTGNAIVGGVNVGKQCTQGSPCSFAQLLAAYPNASVRPVTGQNGGEPIGGGVYFKAGANWNAGTYNVDSLTAAVDIGGVNGTVTYDFEG